MNIQDKIQAIITILHAENIGLKRSELLELLSQAGHTASDWNTIFDRALEEGLLKVKNQRKRTLTFTPEGKTYLAKPYAVELATATPEGDAAGSVAQAVSQAAVKPRAVDSVTHLTSARSKLQLKLIRAVDRKIALDDFADIENIDLDEVLDHLDELRAHGTQLDVSYFVNEVIGQENVDEVRDSLTAATLDMKYLASEWGDVYNEQELRLLLYVLG